MERSAFLEKRVLFTLFALIWVYLGSRAYFVPFSHDEAATFFHFVQSGEFIPYTGILWDANNHLLNSLLAHISFLAFGSSEFALRLPGLLLVPLYFYFHYRIAQRLKRPIPRWSYLLAIFLTHYIVEYLTYCRGYGMSLAFLAGSIHFAMSYYEGKKPKAFYGSIAFSLLALLANLSLLYPVLILLVYGAILFSLRFPKLVGRDKLRGVTSFLVGGAGLAFCIRFLFDLKAEGALYMGGGSFMEVSLKSLLQCFFHSDGTFYQGYAILLGLIALFAFLASCHKSGSHFLSSEKLPGYLFLGPLIAFHSAHYLLGVNYPEDRAVIYLYPLLVAALCFGADQLHSSNIRWIVLPAPLLLLLIPLYSLSMINLTHQTHPPFRQQRIPERFIETIHERSKGWKQKATVAGYHLRHFVYAFHNYRNGGKLNPFYRRGYPTPVADIQIADKSDTSAFKEAYKTIDHDPITGYSLLQRKERLEREKLFTRTVKGTEGRVQKPFFDLFSSKEFADSLRGRTIIMEFDLAIHSPSKPFEARVVTDITDKNEKKLYYNYFRFDWLRYRWDKGKGFHYSSFVHKIPEKAENFSLYLWNPEKSRFRIDSGKVRFSLYRDARKQEERRTDKGS
ncbi:MAG: ArnT family glycosyltransferase [Flavobacteriales bacterium]